MGKRKRRYIDSELRREVISRAARGYTYRQILDEVDTSAGAITIMFRQWGGVTRSGQVWEPSPNRLTLGDRIEIRVGVERGWSYRRIGEVIGRAASTVCREVNRNGGRVAYKPVTAHEMAHVRSRRPKATKLGSNPVLCQRVIADLQQWWSPQQIARRLHEEFPDDETMRVSPETIYKSIYVQGRGELRRELARCLRTGRARRRPRGSRRRPGVIKDMVMISERPPEVADRAVPGHWEGDLIMGTTSRSAIGTLVERSTRYVMLLHLPDGHSAQPVRDAMTAAVGTLPDHLWKSITWDQGREMAQHAQFSVDTGIDVFFCDPHSPWQRGSNENTNGLLRQWFPKGTDLSQHGPDKLLEVAQSLNNRPRQTLDWKKPAEALADLIDHPPVATTG